ncbi:uncharacterized protein CC84DRAFT_155007 [Paraphaeosphaeria sporulosa]|uniref:Uncharacterized protein n=1 Tax=Paraphaeosphaeria sporulosa TaxID=1460663 RepID=A0A177CYM6_9PLEO|nr:uncharacterized protein CC84DRAFT_155007 [Paraphaeosphaeria sporulosa]OAG12654.1 hypothetical protein CC84DRAFT_155007 [Paraphaeosphaeria sporulosa]
MSRIFREVNCPLKQIIEHPNLLHTVITNRDPQPFRMTFLLYHLAAKVYSDMKLFVPFAMIVCVASASPIGDATPPDNTPLCGYVRMEEDSWWSVGLQTHGRCEPIWDNQTALIYRIDREGCGCAFFVDEETCKGQGDLVLHRGPKLEESRFVEEEKPAWVLCQEIQK